MKRILLGWCAALALVLGLVAAPTTTGMAAEPTLKPVSASGITVLDTRQVRERVWEIDIASKQIGSHVHKGKLQLRVVLPRTYFAPQNKTKRYPVQYLLHGQGGRSSDWTDDTRIEHYTANTDIILVTPEGGSGGWYTDWVHQKQGKQNLETFHIREVIPFIDTNLRTIASKKGRAIAGFSMGGFGAMHYAGRHPELFAHATSFSGGLDLDNPIIRAAVQGSAALNGLAPLNGAFGTAFPGLDKNWSDHNPVRMARNYSGMGISLYAGNGDKKPGWDVIEKGARDSTVTLDRALTRAGVRHHTKLYGNPGTLNGEPCRGDHTWTCVSGAYAEDLQLVVASFG